MLYVYYKIAIGHVQIMGVLATIDFKWSPFASAIMRAHEILAKIPEHVICPDCLLESMSISLDPDAKYRILNWRITVSALLPFITLIVAVCVNMGHNAVKNLPLVNVERAYLTFMIIVMYVYYPIVV